MVFYFASNIPKCLRTRICRNMESDLFSMEDELFLFETFLKLSSQDYNDEAEVFFSEEDSDVSLDVPLYDFFMYDNGERGLNVWVRGGWFCNNLSYCISLVIMTLIYIDALNLSSVNISLLILALSFTRSG